MDVEKFLDGKVDIDYPSPSMFYGDANFQLLSAAQLGTDYDVIKSLIIVKNNPAVFNWAVRNAVGNSKISIPIIKILVKWARNSLTNTCLANCRNVEIAKLLHEEYNLDIGETLIECARINKSNMEVIKYFVEHGANLGLTNKDGKTAVDIARENENNELRKILEPDAWRFGI